MGSRPSTTDQLTVSLRAGLIPLDEFCTFCARNHPAFDDLTRGSALAATTSTESASDPAAALPAQSDASLVSPPTGHVAGAAAGVSSGGVGLTLLRSPDRAAKLEQALTTQQGALSLATTSSHPVYPTTPDAWPTTRV